MNFHQRLEKIRTDFDNGEAPPEVIEVVNAHIEHLLKTNADENALKEGNVAPQKLDAYSEDGRVSLHDLFGKRYLVLTWFRGNW